jgi:hypothetical protein
MTGKQKSENGNWETRSRFLAALGMTMLEVGKAKLEKREANGEANSAEGAMPLGGAFGRENILVLSLPVAFANLFFTRTI